VQALVITDPDQPIAANLVAHAEAARGAYADETRRALRGDIALFTRWCAGTGLMPLPAYPETVAAFVELHGDQPGAGECSPLRLLDRLLPPGRRDEHRRAEPDILTRTEAIRRLIRAGLDAAKRAPVKRRAA
jgi:hypothetical protein